MIRPASEVLESMLPPGPSAKASEAMPPPSPTPAWFRAPSAPVRLPLIGGGFTLVDPDIAERLHGRPLYYGFSRRYVQVREDGHCHLLHRLVIPCVGREVHHRNADRLDNRRANLVALSPSEHRLLEPTRRRGREWLGVDRHRGFFRARAGMAQRAFHLGYFASPYLAALARDDFAIRRTQGQVALNFPRTIPSAALRRWFLRRPGDFRVVFVPRGGGLLRRMHARLPTPLELAARPPVIDAKAHRLVSVIDVDDNEYRFIPLEGVLCMQANGLWCRIDRRRRASTVTGTSSAPPAAPEPSPPPAPCSSAEKPTVPIAGSASA
jgi:hypothetical protein